MDGVRVQNTVQQQFQREEIDFDQTGIHAVVQILKLGTVLKLTMLY